MTESSTGAVPSLPASVALTCRKRARSLVIGSPFRLRVGRRPVGPGGVRASRCCRCGSGPGSRVPRGHAGLPAQAAPARDGLRVLHLGDEGAPRPRRPPPRVDSLPRVRRGERDRAAPACAASAVTCSAGKRGDHRPGAVVADPVELALVAGAHQDAVAASATSACGVSSRRGPERVDLAGGQDAQHRSLGRARRRRRPGAARRGAGRRRRRREHREALRHRHLGHPWRRARWTAARGAAGGARPCACRPPRRRRGCRPPPASSAFTSR